MRPNIERWSMEFKSVNWNSWHGRHALSSSIDWKELIETHKEKNWKENENILCFGIFLCVGISPFCCSTHKRELKWKRVRLKVKEFGRGSMCWKKPLMVLAKVENHPLLCWLVMMTLSCFSAMEFKSILNVSCESRQWIRGAHIKFINYFIFEDWDETLLLHCTTPFVIFISISYPFFSCVLTDLMV